MTYVSYFKSAIWLPMVVLPVLLLLDAFYFSSPLRGGLEQFVLIYVLGFGLVAYVLFAVFSTRLISRRTELEVVRLAWWAPVVFIPFYGMPWVVYGIGCLAFGRLAGLGMMFLWLTYIPYVLVVGAFFSVVTVFTFKILSKFLLFSERR